MVLEGRNWEAPKIERLRLRVVKEMQQAEWERYKVENSITS